MIKSFTIYTQEVDDVDAAIEEIQSQLEGENRYLKNTVGIVSCYSEFVDTGVWKALCEKLPFDCVGTTTIANGVRDDIGEMLLTIMVLTSDDVDFAIGLSDPITEETAVPLEKMYVETAEKLGNKPDLMMSFCPLLNNFGSDFYVDSMTKISGNVPNFGTLAVDHHQDYRDSSVLLNGMHYKNRFAILLMSGDIHPKFFVGNISNEKLFAERGIVTDTQVNQLKCVNDKPVIQFLESLGLKKDESGNIVGINSFPIILDYNDGTTPISRAMFAITPEGYAVCGGNIQVGASLSIGVFDPDEIVHTTKKTIMETLNDGGYQTILMYSCIGRFFAQGYDPLAELQTVEDALADTDIAYMMAYSGGELSPVYDRDGAVYNRNHNNTFIVCAF